MDDFRPVNLKEKLNLNKKKLAEVEAAVNKKTRPRAISKGEKGQKRTK